MLTFPPLCSHKMQSLDRSVYGPLKKFYNSACDSWMLQNGGKCLTIYDVAARLGCAFPQAMTPVNIQSWFRWLVFGLLIHMFYLMMMSVVDGNSVRLETSL